MKAEDAIQALTQCLKQGKTGCLSSRSDGAYRIYVMQGELLAAHGPDDGIWVVRRLVNNGAISDSQGRQVTFYLGQGYRLEELLLDQVPDQLFLDLLVARFRQNILDFSFLSGPINFEEMEAIFVDNIQVGHDSQRLLNEILSTRKRINPLRAQLSTLQLKPGTGHPSTREAARLLDLCSPNVKLDVLLAMSPFEDGQSLSLIQGMMAGGVLIAGNATAAPLDRSPPEQPPAPVHHDAPLDTPSNDLSEAVTISDEIPPPPQASEPVVADVAPPQNNSPAAPPASSEPASFESDPFSQTDDLNAPPSDDPFLQSGTLDDAIQHAREQEERREAARKAASRDSGGFSTTPVSDRARQALAYEEEVDADEMAMFEDYDIRRGDGKGQFSVERKLLDRVDLSKPLVESKPPEDNGSSDLLEMGDTSDMTDSERNSAFSLSFGPPRLDVSEQHHKIDVCNEVLTELSRAIDATHGPGSGRACVQLLIDGTPHQFAVLFMGVETDAGGRINANRIIKNLTRRPESEHRRLLNMGVRNLIERALSSGMEELEDKTMDSMLQRIAGYQMRLGL
jgi:hypothetical protein